MHPSKQLCAHCEFFIIHDHRIKVAILAKGQIIQHILHSGCQATFMHARIATLGDDVPTRCWEQGVGNATEGIAPMATLPYLTYLLVATFLT